VARTRLFKEARRPVAATCPDCALELWKAQPRLLVIRVDPVRDQALMLSGETSRMLTPDALIEAIQSHAT